MKHSPRFERLVDDARTRVHEVDVHHVKWMLDNGEDFDLIDVREESEFAAGHLPRAIHLGKGVIERDIVGKVPNKDEELILYCGGGFRSALAADALQKMGYTRVVSMWGGYKVWVASGLPIVKGE